MLYYNSRLLNNTYRCRVFRQSFQSFYDWTSRGDTIFAPATTIQPGKGSPLAIIRLSGYKVGNVVETMTKLKLLNKNNQIKGDKIIKPRSAKLTKLFDPTNNELIDIGLVLWFPKPHSYTGEDVCELHVHGSQAVMNKLLSILGKTEGMRPAEPGEFTYRAHKNGKMSLLEVEGLSELISSKTDQQRRLALKGLTGSTRKKYESWIESLVGALAHLEASIDFGEDELIGERQVVNECISKLQRLSTEIDRFITIGTRCRDFTQVGARIAILGRPNAGKSTIMNLLCRKEKSIVSDLGGTTRDIVEHSFELGGHTITLSDTAGLKDPKKLLWLEGKQKECEQTNYDGNTLASSKSAIEQHDDIEREGIRRALESAQGAHMILYLYDASNFTNTDDIVEELILVLKNVAQNTNSKIRALQLAINKIDLNYSDLAVPVNINGDVWDDFRKTLKSKLDFVYELDHVDVTLISCKNQTNIDILIEKLSANLDNILRTSSVIDQLNKDEENHDEIEFEYLNERHLSLLQSVHRHLVRAGKLNIETIDEMAQHVRESVDYLSRIVGSVDNEQVLNIIFKDFCIGK